jgi:transposase
MERYHYVGLDVHKKMISYCVKQVDGTVVDEGSVRATRNDLSKWVDTLPSPWIGGMEATLFTGWVYDFLMPYAHELKVGHSYMLRAICASKKKNDRIDAQKLTDALRCNWFPTCHMASSDVRDLRRVLRYRNFLVREATRMKNKTAGLLMETGAQYDKSRLHGTRYFNSLLDRLDETPDSVIDLLRLTHSSMKVFNSNQKKLLTALSSHPDIKKRVELLTTIRGVGEATALTWVLEIDDPHRFSSIKKAVSYCGFCSAQSESAGKAHRGPLSKQRNKHLQTMLIEAAKLAPRWNPGLARVYDKESSRGANRNEATLQVARKLVAYMLSVDKSGKPFEPREV